MWWERNRVSSFLVLLIEILFFTLICGGKILVYLIQWGNVEKCWVGRGGGEWDRLVSGPSGVGPGDQGGAWGRPTGKAGVRA